MEDSVTTLRPYLIHQCACFDKAEYEIIRNSILKHLLAYGAMTTDKLGLLVENHLKRKFNGSLYRYYEAIRQVLEARGEIRYVPRSSPPLIEIAE
jgi:hypothetical protein